MAGQRKGGKAAPVLGLRGTSPLGGTPTPRGAASPSSRHSPSRRSPPRQARTCPTTPVGQGRPVITSGASVLSAASLDSERSLFSRDAPCTARLNWSVASLGSLESVPGPTTARSCTSRRGQSVGCSSPGSVASSRRPATAAQSPSRKWQSERPGTRARSIPAEFPHLREFACGGARELASRSQEWVAFADGLAADVESEVLAHLKACSKCRAFSVFSRSAGLRRQPPLTELTLATLCKDCMHALNRIVAAGTLREKDRILTAMAESMGVGVEGLASHDGVAAQRLDTSFGSLAACAAERERVRAEAPMREELRQVLTRLSNLRASLATWRALAATHFHGRRIPHERLSLVTSADVEDSAEQLLQGLTATAAAMAADWERRWRPADFREVFSLFGEPLFDFGRILLERSYSPLAPVGPGQAEGWRRELDAEPLTPQELAAARPMSVAVRLRPMLAHEAGDEATARALGDGLTVLFRAPSGSGVGEQRLQFDAALDGSQAELFTRSGVKALVHKACEGHVATVFAYGQTGAGKTHSLLGPRDCMSQLADDLVVDEEGRLPGCCYELVDEARCAKVCGQGLLPRAMQFLFTVLEAEGHGPLALRASFMEIYNEKVFDLLNPSATQLEVHQKPPPEQGFHVPGLTRMECRDVQSLLHLLRQGAAARHTNGHSCSRDSSRAHAVFTIELPASASGRQGGRLVFADLAGSERTKRIQGASTQETAHINKSLLMLSNCISALATGSCEPSAVSGAFRNSKLTKVLMESLCGTGYTLLLAAISPAQRHFDETANTLFFAAKCANVTRRPEPKLTPHQREVRELQETVDALRAELIEARSRCCGCRTQPSATAEGGPDEGAAGAGVAAELAALRRELEAERQKNAALQRDLFALRRGDQSRRSAGDAACTYKYAGCGPSERGRRDVRARSATGV